MAKTSPEKLAAALRANLARRKAGPQVRDKPSAAAAPAKSRKSPQNGAPAAPSTPHGGPKPAR
jgi:hypothetical protein